MNLKQYHRYRMQFTGKWANGSAICMGASIFLLAVYFFLLRDFSSIKTGEAVFLLALPLLLGVAYLVLFRFVRLNSPGAFAILGAVFCLVLMIGSFSTGYILRIVLGCVWYILSALVMLACAGGFLPGALPASLMFRVAFIVRLLFDLKVRSLSTWVFEASNLALILSLSCLPMLFVPVKHKR